MLWIQMKPAVLENDVLFEEFIDRVAQYTVQAMVGAAKITAGTEGTFCAALSVGYGTDNAEGTFGVMFNAAYEDGDELNGPVMASDRYGVTFWDFRTKERALEFADKFGQALQRDEKEYTVRIVEQKTEKNTVN